MESSRVFAARMPRISRWILPTLVIGLSLAAPLRAAGPLAELEEQAIRAAVERVAPSVVRIETVGGLQKIGELLLGTGPTTGLVVSADGFIVSSAFNFVQKPDSILVTLSDGTRLPAKLVATDHSRALVLLKVKAEQPLAVPVAVPAAELRSGQWAIAVGRTFEADKPNVSVGIVSALDRVWGRAIQTDAKISPNNYGGPLVDISGRVLGVLVPLAPDATSQVAGVEWYDSGIGFAVPLDHVLKVLPKWSAGKDLYTGILGINLKGNDPYSQPAVIAACRVNSPAYEAHLQAGDTIVEINGKPVTRQAQLKQELNRHYAGDKVRLVVMRKDQRIENEVELIDKLEPYEFPFIGILPMRPMADMPEGLFVRYVYPDGPAAKAGILAGDQIVSIGGSEVKDAAAAAERLRTLLPDAKVAIGLRREGQPLNLEITLGRLPSDVPAELPPAHAAAKPAEGGLPAVGVVEIKIPEVKNECLAFVPTDYNPNLKYGVVIWLHAPGGYKQEELLARWQDRCQKHDLILLAPKSADPTRWIPAEAKFVQQTLAEVLKTYQVDRTRIIVHGQEAGGALSYLVAFGDTDAIRGVAPISAPMPQFATLPDNDPLHRLAFFIATASKGPFAPAVDAGIKRLREAKFPVTVKELGEQPRYLNDEELSQLLRWLDSLDRL
jgi:serine protease Do